MSAEARKLGMDLLRRGPIDTTIVGKETTIHLAQGGGRRPFVGKVVVWDGHRIETNRSIRPHADLGRAVSRLGKEVLRVVVRRE